jgi:phosphate transport system substrate-binding protein
MDMGRYTGTAGSGPALPTRASSSLEPRRRAGALLRALPTLLGLCAVLCQAAPGFAADRKKLTATGTGSAVAVFRRLAAAFQEQRPGFALEVLPSIGSTGGIKAVQAGKIQIGLTSRPLKPEERAQGLVEEPYGRTAFLFAAQASNPETGFSLQEIEEIFAGTRVRWRDGSPFRLVLRPQADAFSVYLAALGPGLKAAAEKAQGIPGVFVGMTDQDAVAQIERTPGAFGVTSACLVAGEERKVKGLAVDGVAPTLANLASGAYPYAMTLSVVYRKDPADPAIEQFVRFLFSPRGRQVLIRSGHQALARAARP